MKRIIISLVLACLVFVNISYGQAHTCVFEIGCYDDNGGADIDLSEFRVELTATISGSSVVLPQSWIKTMSNFGPAKLNIFMVDFQGFGTPDVRPVGTNFVAVFKQVRNGVTIGEYTLSDQLRPMPGTWLGNEAVCFESTAPKPKISVANVSLCQGTTGNTVVATIENAPGDILTGGYTISWGDDANITTEAGSLSATAAVGTIKDGLTSSLLGLQATLKKADGTVAATSAAYDVTVNPVPDVKFDKNAYEVCKGNSIDIKVLPAGGTYNWTDEDGMTIATGQTFTTSSLSANATYSVEVTLGGCSASNTVSVKVNELPVVNTLVVDGGKADVCAGTGIGLTATVSGGTQPYTTYTWSGGASGATVSGTVASVGAGVQTYGLKVTDSKNCVSKEKTTSVTGHQVTITPLDVEICNGESATLQAAAVFEPDASKGEVKYTWTGDDIASGADGATMVTNVLNEPGDKIFHVKVEDGFKCSAEKDVKVTVKKCTEPKIVVTGVEFCEGKTGQSVKAAISGVGGDFPTGYTVEWGSNQISTSGAVAANTTGSVGDGLSASIIDIKAILKKDGVQIAESDAYSVIVNPLPTIVSLVEDAGKTDVCDGNDVNLTAVGQGGTGKLDYVWTGGPVGTSGKVTVAVAAGEQTYTVSVKDAKGCGSTDSKTLNVTGHKVTASPVGTDVCSGLTATLTANAVFVPDDSKGEVKYTWSGSNIATGGQSPSMTTSALTTIGTEPYKVTVVDGFGCSDEKTVNVTVKECGEELAVTNNTPTPTGCMNSDINLSVTASGGPSTNYTYEWSAVPNNLTIAGTGANVLAQASTAGTYQVTVVVKSGSQSKTENMTVTVTDCGGELTVTNNTPTPMGCSNSDITLSVTAQGGPSTSYTYEWSAVPNNLTITGTGASVIARAAVAGTYQVAVVVKSGNQSKTVNMSVTVADCGEVALNMTVDQKCAYTNEHLTITITGLGADSYSFILRDQSNNPVMTVNNQATWQPYLVATNAAGEYKITDFKYTIAGVTKSGTPPAPVKAMFNPIPNVYAVEDQRTVLPHCLGDLLTLKASGDAGMVYSWDRNVQDGVPFNPSAGMYTVTATNPQTMCENKSSVTVTIHDKPSIQVPNNSEICRGESVILTATSTDPTAVLSWNNGVTNGVSFKPDVTAVYEATAKVVATGCFSKGVVNVVVNQPPMIVHTSKNPRNIAIGKDVYFAVKATGNHLTYQWKRKSSGAWMNLTDANSNLPAVIGAQTDSLRLKSVPKEWDGSELRCVVSGDCGKDSTDFLLNVKECFEIKASLEMGDGIVPDEVAANKIDGWYCPGQRISLRAVVTSDEGYEIENPHYRWSIDGLDLPEEHWEMETDTPVLSWVPEFQEDDIVVKVCVYSDGACEEVCPKYLRLKAKKFEDVSFKLLTSTDPKHKFCPGDTVNFWVASKNAGQKPVYTWYNDVFKLPEQESPKNKVLHYENEKVTMTMGQEDTWMRVVLTPSKEVCVSDSIYVDTVYMMKKTKVVPSLHIICADTVACRGDEIPMRVEYANAGVNPTFQWQRSIGEPFHDWNLGTDVTAKVKLDEDDVWVKCTMKPSDDVCYDDGSSLVDAVKIRVLKLDASVQIACDMKDKEPGDELLFTSEVKNILGEARYEWMVNDRKDVTEDREFSCNTLVHGDVVYCLVSGERVCQSKIESNRIVVNFGRISRDTMLTIYRNERIQDLNLLKPGDENKLFVLADYPHDGIAKMTLMGGVFSYTPNQNFVGVDYIRYLVKDKSDQTKVEEGHIYVSVKENGLDDLPNVITPNGDGLNDEWHLESITERYTDYEIRVYNRVGNIVFHCKNNYMNDWNGQSMSNPNYSMPLGILSSGVYTYVIELNRGQKKLMSWLEIRAGLNRGSYR